jgi:hypothetical protein
MVARYETKNRIYFTTAVVAIFVFASFVFLLYDYLVERRQRVVLKKAVHSTAIVDSLFPSNVRDRLFDTTGPEQAKKVNNRVTFLSRQVGQGMDWGSRHGAQHAIGGESRPIADLVGQHQ